MNNLLKTTLAAGVMAVGFAGGASAAVVSVGAGSAPVDGTPSAVANLFDIKVGESNDYEVGVFGGFTETVTFNAVGRVLIEDFIALVATGDAGTVPLVTIDLTTSDGSTEVLNRSYTITSPPGSANDAGNTFFDGFILGAGETFTLTFDFTAGPDGVEVGNNVSFNATPSPIPVPASALMLLTALAGGAAVARRKAKKTA
jgi:hypothetical protein